MKKFEIGKTYRSAGGYYVTVVKRSAHYVTLTGDFTGRKMIAEFNDSERVIVPDWNWRNGAHYCSANNEV